MKKRDIIIGLSIIMNLGLFICIMNIHGRLDSIESDIKTNISTTDEIVKNNENMDDINKNLRTLNHRLDELGELALDIRTYGLEQRAEIVENDIKRIENLLFKQPSVDILSGEVVGINTETDIVKLEVKPKEILRNEEAITALMTEKGCSRQEAESKIESSGCYLHDSKKEKITLAIPNDCQVYLIGTAGLVKANMDNLIEKATSEVKGNFVDDYTFILLDNKVIQVYQAYIP